MLDVLIADDEPAALRSLRHLIPWEEYGFRIGGEASNGEEALAKFREGSYELVISDIRMPRMDGLRLIEAIRERSDVAIILLSGYGEFEYARRAIQLGVNDYLLKPVNSDELRGKLLAAKSLIESKKRESRLWHRGIPLVREQLVRRWARGLSVDPAAFDEFKLSVGDAAAPFCVFILELSDLLSTGGKSRADIQLRRFAVRNVAEELFGGQGLLFEESVDRFGVVYRPSERELGAEALAAQARLLRNQVAAYARADIAVSVGPVVKTFSEVPGSYEAALEVLNKKGMIASEEPVWLADNARMSRDSHYRLVEEAKQIVKERFATNLELKQIAAELYANANQLGQLFRGYAGMSFKDYLLKTRLDAAKDLLAYTDKKVYEIAEEVGFKEIDWFYKKFKLHTGRSANEFRANR